MTSNLLREAEAHLIQRCSVMAELVPRYRPCLLFEQEPQPFAMLAKSIISQQLSAKAAETRRRRVQLIIPGFTPAGFLAISSEELRAAGLSASKIRYILGVAQRVSDGRLNLGTMQQMPDADVVAALVDLPGIGQWTAEMFLIFGLRRLNVLPLGDAGLQRAVRLLFGQDATLERVGSSWRPFCSVAAWYLWRTLD